MSSLIRLFWHTDGVQATVLLLHSTVCGRRMWDHQAGTLSAAGRRVIRCDLSGYGESPPPTADYNDAEGVLALLDHLGEGAVDPARITAETLVISVGRDVTDFHEIAERPEERIPRARHMNLEWAGHQPTPERPEEMDPICWGFPHRRSYARLARLLRM
ncbi:MAG: alpha/beta fold hydrolase [Corynebacterium sp.]|uniref:alpha/beta fold hydrolase n=1 Tax=Corynebacterium sp. TaxID=1720 RepID=UPI003F97710B